MKGSNPLNPGRPRQSQGLILHPLFIRFRSPESGGQRSFGRISKISRCNLGRSCQKAKEVCRRLTSGGTPHRINEVVNVHYHFGWKYTLRSTSALKRLFTSRFIFRYSVIAT